MFDIKQSVDAYMSVVMTHECNKKCHFCIDAYRGRKEYISLTNVEKSISFAKEQTISDILIIGGEPSLHPNILDIIKMYKSSGFRVIMTTNYTKPDVIKSLDGLVDDFNISFYNQNNLNELKDFISDITIHTLIHKQSIKNIEELNNFIDTYCSFGHLKFSTLSICNDWTLKNQESLWLNDLDCEWTLLFNEIAGQIYKGCVIKRYDMVINKKAKQSFKFHVDGEISDSWNRNII